MNFMEAAFLTGLLPTGNLRALAVTSATRHPLFPDVPTTTEMGHPEILSFIWMGLAAPAGTPQAIVDKISADVREIVKQPAFTERFIATPGWTTIASTPAETDQIIKSDLPIIRDMSAATGIKPQ